MIKFLTVEVKGQGQGQSDLILINKIRSMTQFLSKTYQYAKFHPSKTYGKGNVACKGFSTIEVKGQGQSDLSVVHDTSPLKDVPACQVSCL